MVLISFVKHQKLFSLELLSSYAFWIILPKLSKNAENKSMAFEANRQMHLLSYCFNISYSFQFAFSSHMYLCLSYELFSGYDSVLGTNGTLDIEKNQYSIRSRCGTVSLFHFLNSKRILCPPIPTHTIIARMQISSILVMMVLSLFSQYFLTVASDWIIIPCKNIDFLTIFKKKITMLT